jgi:hypothetical protein
LSGGAFPRPVVISAADADDKDVTMIFSRGSLRRLNVTVNGITEFAALERCYTVTASALEAVKVNAFALALYISYCPHFSILLFLL